MLFHIAIIQLQQSRQITIATLQLSPLELQTKIDELQIHWKSMWLFYQMFQQCHYGCLQHQVQRDKEYMIGDIVCEFIQLFYPTTMMVLIFLQKKRIRYQLLSYGKLEDKVGWNASPTAMVLFDNVCVPQFNLFGREGYRFKMAMSTLDGGRINIASFFLKDYLHNRKQFGQTLAAFQGLQFKFADKATNLVTSRLTIRQVDQMIENNHLEKTLYSVKAKRNATDSIINVANEANTLNINILNTWQIIQSILKKKRIQISNKYQYVLILLQAI